MDSIILTKEEIEQITGYTQATKQLNVLQRRGFLRAYIDRNGRVVLERNHYDAVTSGQFSSGERTKPKRAAELSFMLGGGS